VHEAWPEAADLVEQRGSTRRLDEADVASRWQLTSSEEEEDRGAVAVHLLGDGGGCVLARTGQRLGPGVVDAGDFYSGKRLCDAAAQLIQLGRGTGRHRQ
jgi:hypothetical protein